jgi:hypothetical protein
MNKKSCKSFFATIGIILGVLILLFLFGLYPWILHVFFGCIAFRLLWGIIDAFLDDDNKGSPGGL